MDFVSSYQHILGGPFLPLSIRLLAELSLKLDLASTHYMKLQGTDAAILIQRSWPYSFMIPFFPGLHKVLGKLPQTCFPAQNMPAV